MRPGYKSPLTLEVLRLAALGLTAGEIGVAAGITRKAVYDIARRHKAPLTGVGVRTVERVRACAEAGMTRGETAAHLGLSVSTVHLAARRGGVSLAPPVHKRPMMGLSEAQRDDYRHIRRKGFRAHEARAMVEARP